MYVPVRFLLLLLSLERDVLEHSQSRSYLITTLRVTCCATILRILRYLGLISDTNCEGLELVYMGVVVHFFKFSLLVSEEASVPIWAVILLVELLAVL